MARVDDPQAQRGIGPAGQDHLGSQPVAHERLITPYVETKEGIFCLEGAWEKRLDDRASVLPTLDLLERLQLGPVHPPRRRHRGRSCSVMCDGAAVADFYKLTGAKAICGYTEDVDWAEAASFDLLLLSSLVSDQRIDARINRVRRRYAEFANLLGFVSHPSYDRS